MIIFNSIDRQKSRISYFRTELKKSLQKQDYFAPSFLAIAQRSLRCFNFKRPFEDEKSIQEGCVKVIEAASGRKIPKEEAIEYFTKLLLELDSLPVVHKLTLENVVKKDLAEIDVLLAHYYSLDEIRKNLKEPTTPRNHKEKTIIDFFKRTLNKKEKIINHLLHGLEDIAIEKATLKSSLSLEFQQMTQNSEMLQKYQYHNEFPYTDIIIEKGFSYKIDYEKLDYRRINPLRNKREYFKSSTDIGEGLTPKLEREFQIKFTRKKAIKLLDLILQKVTNLPILKARKEIFAELRLLYKAKKWYGFYGLALPQIEGIFSEMTSILEPKRKPIGSLTNKVQQVRPFYELSDHFFDYYEYYLPEERNKFSHIGRMENIQLKSSFLIIDLWSILKIFEGLDTPLIELNNLTNEGPVAFTEIGKFRHFLTIIKKINPTHLSEIQPNLDNLMYNVLPNSLDIIEFIDLLKMDFRRAASSFEQNITLILHSQSSPQFRIFEMTHKFLHENLEHLDKALKNQMKAIFEKELQLLLDASIFVTEFIKLFPKQSVDIKKTIAAFKSENEKTLSIVNFLRKKIDILIPDYVYLFATDWKHNRLLQNLKSAP